MFTIFHSGMVFGVMLGITITVLLFLTVITIFTESLAELFKGKIEKPKKVLKKGIKREAK